MLERFQGKDGGWIAANGSGLAALTSNGRTHGSGVAVFARASKRLGAYDDAGPGSWEVS